jgi:sulfate adenylyltransferase subunit 1 (EFTu-like GTPase family)
MATSASTTDVAVLLVTRATRSRGGTLHPLPWHQRFRLAINQMDIRFDRAVLSRLSTTSTSCCAANASIPISALDGDNVIATASAPWFDGKPLLNFLETVEVDRNATATVRMPVQIVLRPNQEFRGFAGQVSRASSNRAYRPTLPSGRKSK